MKQDHPDLSVRRQCSLLSLARSSLYYQPRGESAENLAFMEIIDRQFLETPWYGSRHHRACRSQNGHRPICRTRDAMDKEPRAGR